MHLYIVHGYGASPSDHWFSWLKNAMEKKGASVSIVNLPAPDAPQPNEWQQALESQVASLDEGTYFVAHSLGSIALLRFLEGVQGKTIGGYLLVSGFNNSLPALPQLDSFKKPTIDYGRLVDIASNRVVVSAIDDPSVPHAFSESLANSLKAKFVSVQRGGHFLGSDGFTEFPLVINELEIAVASRQ
jgi:hypothetical protein